MRYWLAVVFIVLVAAGCNANQEAKQALPQAHQEQIKTDQTIPPKPEIHNPDQVSSRLEALAESIPKVNNANCVVIGNTAIVGIDVDGDLERSKVGTIKYSVAEALRTDPYGVHAIVTADMDVNARLEQLRQEMAAGRPISGMADALADLVGRVMPQMPTDTTIRE